MVGETDYPLALAAGQPFADGEVKVARRLGVTDKEIDKLCAALVKALVDEALDPDRLRKKLGDAVRNLGAEGQRKGLTTTLPVALGLLQAAGAIRRVPVNGRIDGQRYKYAAWRCAPKGNFTDLARRYFSWIGPATVSEFQTFAGLGVKATKEALEPLGLIEAEPGMWLLPEDGEAYKKFQLPKKLQYALVSSLDGITHLRDDWKSLTDDTDVAKKRGGASHPG